MDLAGRLERVRDVETDVVVLDTAGLRLVHRVLGEGELIFDAEWAERVRYEATLRKI